MNNFTRKGLFIFLFMAFALAAHAQEPTNHPTGFTAATQAGGTSVKLDWTGSIGANLPSNYLILVRVVPGGTFATPVDAAAVANDNDLSDNLGAFNATHAVGANTYTWTGLPIDTDFEFIIYPYKTGAAPDPNFKLDGSPLTATATTKRPTVTSPTVDTPNIAEQTATAGGNVTSDGGNPLLAKGVVWKANTPGASLSDNVVTHGTTATGVFTVGLTGMPEGTIIYYRAYATNVAGTTYSAESSFYTIALLPSQHPTVTATGVRTNRVTVTYTAASANGTNTDGYVILRTTAPTDPQTSEVDDGVAPTSIPLTVSTRVRVVTDVNETSFNDDTVVPDTEYRYAVVPFNWDGTNPETYNYRVGGGFNIDAGTTFSASSDIVLNGGTQGDLHYRDYQSASPNMSGSNTETLATFQVRDGGAGNDADGQTTRLTSVTIGITNWENLRKVALYDGGNRVGGDYVAAASITFDLSSYVLEDSDNGAGNNFTIAATYNSPVDDKENVHVTITAATALNTGSGFINATAGGASTSTLGNINRVDVDAVKIRFVADPPSTPVATNFTLHARALDGQPHNSVDKDFTGQIHLTKSPVAGTLTSGGGQSLSPNMVAGEFQWTQLQISQAGSYTLYVDDNASVLDNDDANITITSSGANITQAAPLTVCFGSVPKTLTNIVIAETDNAGFSSSGTFSLALPNGFIFDNTVTSIGPTVGGGSDISAPSNYSYPSANVVQFSYTISGSSNLNTITIGGLKVTAPHPGGASPATISGNITRSGGSATIAGDAPGQVHGSVTAELGTPPAGGVNFTVVKIDADDLNVDPGETRFSQAADPVRLVGTPAGGTFTGPGVTLVSGQYRFNPQALSPGSYDVVYTVNNGGDQCDFVFQKTFEVYVTNIVGLAAQYCTNSPPSPPLDVSQAYINSRYGAAYKLTKFVYYNPYSFPFYVDLTPVVPNPELPPDPVNTAIFEPADPKYSQLYSVFGGIWIGFYVSNGINTFLEWQFIPVRVAPTPTFTIAKPKFCADESAVQLIGSPANSNVIGDDFFTASQGGTITQSGMPVQWFFNPVSATGVTDGNPASIDITYTYRDPVTGCSAVSPTQTISVAKRPPSVLAAALSTPVTQAVCQGKAVPTFSATPDVDITYTWYLVDKTTQVYIGNTFTPPGVDTNVPGPNTFWVKQTIDGCESNSGPAAAVTPLELRVNVTATPAAPTANRDLEYCVGEAIPANVFLIPSANDIKWYKAGDFSAPIVTSTNPTPAQLNISNLAATIYTFDVTQTEPGGCEGTVNPTKVTVEIKALPSLTIEPTADVSKICTSGPQITFQGKDGGLNTTSGTWSGAGLTGLVQGPGNAVLTTTALLPDNYTLNYQYTNGRGCTNSTSIPLKVLPRINTSLLPLDSCEGIFVRLNNTSTVNSGPHPVSQIAFAQWNFSDGSGLPNTQANLTIDPLTNNGRTRGIYNNPEHRFNTTGSFTVQYTLTTTEGCVYAATKQLTINPKPKINFNWRGVCRDTLSGESTTVFQAVELSQPQINIPPANYFWEFNVDGVLQFASAGTGANPTVRYNVNGRDTARLIVMSAAQCRDTIQKSIFVVPSFTKLREENSYSQDFNTSDGGWIAGGANSSWAHGQLAGPVVNMDASASGTGMAWDTNPTGSGISNDREQSWVMCPCFTFTATQKPIISMDIWSDTPLLNDGAVLQYNLTGNVENDADWIVVGAPGQGANWYDETGISSSPGNQSVDPNGNDVGWTGIYNGWRKAAYKLDPLNGETSVVFRIAFASNVPRREGFAFDNVFVGERTRTVLLESFTNSSQQANTGLHNDFFSNFANNSTELAKIQFHTQFPGADPLNDANSEINNSRAAFYGVTETGKFSIDGSIVNGPAALTKLYDDRVLTPSPIRINIAHAKDGEVVKINTTLKNITSQILPTTGLTFFVAIVEKSITDDAYLGTEPDEFTFVARKMLPDASGTVITENIPALGEITLPEIIWNDPGLLPGGEASIIVFIQSTEGNNKTVVQSKIIDASVLPDVTTSVSFPEAFGKVSVYPNPANHTVTVQYDEPLNESMQVRFVDTFGKEVFSGTMPRGERSASIATRDFAPGMYLIRFRKESGAVAWGKVVVTH